MANNTQQIINYLQANYSFRKNFGNQKVEFHDGNSLIFKELTDEDLNTMKVNITLQNIPCSRETLSSIIFSSLWPTYDPYKEWLNKLPIWDGEDHIRQLSQTVKTDDDDYFYWCLKKWLAAFVGSLDKEDVVNQTAIIFCGKQGIGKSTWFKNILPKQLQDFYAMGFLQPKDKETKIQLSALALYNMDEAENMKAKHIEETKELITESQIYTRRAYTKLSKRYVRRCSFCGTANGVQILHDLTGNRRFLCQNVTDIDFGLKNVNLPQVYAQAYQLFKAGFQFWFDQKEQAMVESHNSRFKAVSVEEELITTYFEPCDDSDKDAILLQAHQVLGNLMSKTTGIRLSAEKVGKMLSLKGFKRKKVHGIAKWIVKEKQQQ